MPRDDRARFHRRGRFAAIALCVAAVFACLAGLMQLKRPRFHAFCETYYAGYEPKGCSAKDMAEWKALGLKPAPGSDLPKP